MLLVWKQRQRAVLSKNTWLASRGAGELASSWSPCSSHTQDKTRSTSCCHLGVFSFKSPIAWSFLNRAPALYEPLAVHQRSVPGIQAPGMVRDHEDHPICISWWQRLVSRVGNFVHLCKKTKSVTENVNLGKSKIWARVANPVFKKKKHSFPHCPIFLLLPLCAFFRTAILRSHR